MSEHRPAVVVSGWLVVTAAHLSGVVALGVASYFDRSGTARALVEPLAYWGMASFIFGPAAVLAMVVGRRVTGWQVPVALAVAGAIELTAVIAMLPLIQ